MHLTFTEKWQKYKSINKFQFRKQGRVKSPKKAEFAEQIQRCHIALLIPAKYKK